MQSSPTARLLAGFLITLAAVLVYSRYTLQQIDGLRVLQTQAIDRNRKDSLQLLRIQNSLNTLALAMRDMRSREEPYPLSAYEAQFRRVRGDLDDALRLERELAPSSRTSAQQQMLASLLANLWNLSGRIFELARAGNEKEAQRMIDARLQPAHAAVTGAIARLLVSNNEAEERAIAEVQQIYDRVERNIYRFLFAVLLAIGGAGLALIYFNRRIFARLHSLTEQKGTLARKLIEVQENVLHSVSRELHDEFGQILTAIGSMLSRAERRALPGDSALRQELSEAREVAQTALDRVRTLSQALHPSLLDDYGLERTVEWHLKNFERQTGIHVHYEKRGDLPVIKGDAATHVYRILQEALNNVARHSQSTDVQVRLIAEGSRIRLEVEDNGVGMPAIPQQSGLGLTGMRERAELLGGKLTLVRPRLGGALVSLEAPVGSADQPSGRALTKVAP